MLESILSSLLSFLNLCISTILFWNLNLNPVYFLHFSLTISANIILEPPWGNNKKTIGTYIEVIGRSP